MLWMLNVNVINWYWMTMFKHCHSAEDMMNFHSFTSNVIYICCFYLCKAIHVTIVRLVLKYLICRFWCKNMYFDFQYFQDYREIIISVENLDPRYLRYKFTIFMERFQFNPEIHIITRFSICVLENRMFSIKMVESEVLCQACNCSKCKHIYWHDFGIHTLGSW